MTKADNLSSNIYSRTDLPLGFILAELALPERQQSLTLKVSAHLIPLEILVSSRSSEHRVKDESAFIYSSQYSNIILRIFEKVDNWIPDESIHFNMVVVLLLLILNNHKFSSLHACMNILAIKNMKVLAFYLIASASFLQ